MSDILETNAKIISEILNNKVKLNDYLLLTSGFIIDYIDHIHDKKKLDKIHNEYFISITSRGFLTKSQTNYANEEFYVCVCGIKNKINETGQSVCYKCHKITKISVVKNNIQAKLMSETMRHYTKSMENLFSLSAKIDPIDLRRILETAKAKYNAYELVKINDDNVRSILHKLKLQKYNSYTPFLISRISKKTPPEFQTEELIVHRNLFIKFINTFEQLKMEKLTDRSSKLHYQYTIFRIFDIMFDNRDNERLENIFRFIHTQSTQTLLQSNKIFNMILEKLKINFVSNFKLIR
jgi:hypothetical protein